MTRWIWVGVMILVVAVANRGWGDSEVHLPEKDPLEVKGDLEFAGSSTVTPLIRRLYKRFILEGYRSEMKIHSIGTSRGFTLFCQEGKADIVMASRPIKAHETLACAAQGRTPVEFHIGTDMLTLVTSSEKAFFSGASMNDLQLLFTANQWGEVNPEWPNEPIRRFIPGPGSGTFDFFVDTIFDGDADAILAAANTEQNGDPNTIAQSVGNEINSLGIVGYAFYKKYQKTLRTVAIDLVKPSPTSAARGDYVLARNLFVYSDVALIRDKPQVRGFLTFLLNHVSQEIEKVGYFALPAEYLDESKRAFLEAMGIEP